MRFVDSSVLIAAAHENHAFFAASHAFLAGLRKGGAGIAAHGAVETFSALTRPPLRFSPVEAAAYLARLTEKKLRVFSLPEAEVLAVIAEAPDRGVAGGRVFDALLARIAAKAGAKTIVAWNEKRFLGLEPGVDAITPEKAMARD